MIKTNDRTQKSTYMARKPFELKLIGLYGRGVLEKRETSEEGVKLTLYYDISNPNILEINGEKIEEDDHVATYNGGNKNLSWYYEKTKS